MYIIQKKMKDLLVIKESDSINRVYENDLMAPCYGDITQHVLNEEGKLTGIITSLDIERMRNVGGEQIADCINRNPILLIDGPFVKDLASVIFEKKNIRQIPVVDRENHLLYALEIPNMWEKAFYNYTQRKIDLNYIEETLISLRKQFPDKKVYIITPDHLEKLSEYIIEFDQIKMSDKDNYILLFTFAFEYQGLEILRKLKDNHIKYFICPMFENQFRYSIMKYMNTDEMGMKVLEEEAKLNGSYYDAEDFQDFFQVIQLTKEVLGCYLEIGIFRGDSARAALSYMQKCGITRKGYFIDLFEGFVYDKALQSEDLAISMTTPHIDTSMEIVKKRLEEYHNITIIKADIIDEELPEEIDEIAVCNIDIGMYEAEDAALNKVADKIVRGGVIITHNFGRTPGCIGAHLAIKEFYENNRKNFYGIYMASGQFIMIRK